MYFVSSLLSIVALVAFGTFNYIVASRELVQISRISVSAEKFQNSMRLFENVG
jgi:hypothetical protein